jgi:Ca2+-binding EF-hand superfamily protein
MYRGFSYSPECPQPSGTLGVYNYGGEKMIRYKTLIYLVWGITLSSLTYSQDEGKGRELSSREYIELGSFVLKRLADGIKCEELSRAIEKRLKEIRSRGKEVRKKWPGEALEHGFKRHDLELLGRFVNERLAEGLRGRALAQAIRKEVRQRKACLARRKILRRWLIKKFDRDGDGKLDAAEKARARQILRHHRKRLLKRFDKDGDGRLDRREFRNALKHHRRRWMLKHFDKNRDGKLSRREKEHARRVIKERHKEWRKNRKERLNRLRERHRELRERHKELRDKHKRHRRELKKRHREHRKRIRERHRRHHRGR